MIARLIYWIIGLIFADYLWERHYLPEWKQDYKRIGFVYSCMMLTFLSLPEWYNVGM